MDGQNLEILNLVHRLASISWNNGPNPASPARISPTSPNNTIVGSRRSLSKSPIAKNENDLVPETPCCTGNHSHKQPYPLSSSADKVKSGRRIQPMSVPRKPPDIQNLALFPPIGGESPSAAKTTAIMKTPSSVASSFGGRTKVNFKSLEPRLSDPFSPHTSNFGDCQSNPSTSNTNTSVLKLRQLENKISGKATPSLKQSLNFSGQNEVKSSENGSRNSLKPPDQPRRVPRSAEIFAELTPEIIIQVDKVAKQYSSILDRNWCRNVLEELNFLFQLISSCWDPSGNAENSIPKKKLMDNHSPNLPTAPQQIYFVIKVLNLQLDSALFSVDPRIIQLLVEKYPHRLPKPIRKHFESWAQAQRERTLALKSKNPGQSTQKPSEFHQCVTFRSDDDGRANFPSQGDFHSFCKQRDLFYAIKTSWTTKQKEGTGFKEPENGRITTVSGRLNGGGGNGRVNLPPGRELDPLYPKIKALFNINSSWANLSHLASLFSSQFIMDSFDKTENAVGGTGDDEGIKSFFGSNNLTRLTQLQNRMSAAASSDKNDDLSFVRYFLSIANSPEFNQHLVDRVIHEIYEIESYVDSSSKTAELKELELCLQKTVILSKLLGYLVFLPYRNEGPHTRGGITASLDKEAIISKQLQLRAHQKSPIDLQSKLVLAYNERRLILTLPWVVEFLTSADRVSLELPAYHEPIRILDYLYHNYLSVNQEQTGNPVTLSNLNFMRFWCGKLFSLDIFPHKLYSKGDPKIDIIFKSTDQVSIGQTLAGLDKRKRSFLDSCEYFGDRHLSLYFADQFKKMSDTLHLGLQQQKLSSASSFDLTPNGPEVKHIRPVPARSPVKPVILSPFVQLEMQLEASFFDSKSPSVKKTVDFVAERIASNFVKKLRASMPDIRSQLAIQGIFEDAAVSLCKTEMLSELMDFSKESSVKAMGVLIGDLSTAALNVCEEITSRKCIERVAEWITTHVNSEMFPMIEIPLESSSSTPVGKPVLNLRKISATTATDSKADQLPETSWKPIFDIIILLHRCVKRLHQRKSISEDHIDLILDCSPLSTCSGLGTTLTDFGLTLVTFTPHILSAERVDKLVELIRPQWNFDSRGILCGRNLQLLFKEARTKDQSWIKFTELIFSLTNAQLMSLESVEQDCMALLRQDWEPELSRRISYILKDIVTFTKNSNSRESQASREVLDWVAWACGDNPDEDL